MLKAAEYINTFEYTNASFCFEKSTPGVIVAKGFFMTMLSHSGHTSMHVYSKIKHANNHLLRFSHVIYAITTVHFCLKPHLHLGMILNLLFSTFLFH